MKRELITIKCPKCGTSYRVVQPHKPKVHYCIKCFAIFLISSESKTESS